MPGQPPRRKGGKPKKRAPPTRQRFLPFKPTNAKPRQLELFSAGKKTLGQRVIIQKSPNKMIATLGGNSIATLEFEKRRYKMGSRFISTLFVKSMWVEARSDQGQGVGTQLLNSLIARVKQIPANHRRFENISLDIDSDNIRMIGVAERAGFKQVGQTRHGDYNEKDILIHFRLDL